MDWSLASLSTLVATVICGTFCLERPSIAVAVAIEVECVLSVRVLLFTVRLVNSTVIFEGFGQAGRLASAMGVSTLDQGFRPFLLIKPLTSFTTIGLVVVFIHFLFYVFAVHSQQCATRLRPDLGKSIFQDLVLPRCAQSAAIQNPAVMMELEDAFSLPSEEVGKRATGRVPK